MALLVHPLNEGRTSSVPVTKESIPTGRWRPLGSAEAQHHWSTPGLLTVITEAEQKVSRPSQLWEVSCTVIFISCIANLSSFTVHNEKSRWKSQISAKIQFPGLLWTECIQGRSISPGIARSSLPCFGLSCWIISCGPGSSWWSQKRLSYTWQSPVAAGDHWHR